MDCSNYNNLKLSCYKTLRKHWPVIAALKRRFLPKGLELRETQISQLESQLKELLWYLGAIQTQTRTYFIGIIKQITFTLQFFRTFPAQLEPIASCRTVNTLLHPTNQYSNYITESVGLWVWRPLLTTSHVNRLWWRLPDWLWLASCVWETLKWYTAKSLGKSSREYKHKQANSGLAGYRLLKSDS